MADIRSKMSEMPWLFIGGSALKCAVLLCVLPAMAQTPAAQKVKPSILYVDAPSTSQQRQIEPMTAKQRLNWFVNSTAGIESLLFAGPIGAGIGTARNSPHEYGPGWEGFGQRYGMRLTGISTGNAMEATLGAIWGEDPRYYRAQNDLFNKRLVNVIDMTFRAYRGDGQRHFAYARIMGNVGNNFLSNTWRVPSASSGHRA